ncbi:hypothetical protein PoB_003203500 [Plakobranchus ocellatus]|uniref:Uncharacterized protein n=1 Tax=Plakobranchus ocellatus TaxID=259542 RepID=A0AAV4ABJ5_9GAST|nr:hypothetical protein PoB_003203500 [Plakobranchus ocellatus]
MSDFPNSMKPTRQKIIYKVCTGATQYKVFVQERGTYFSCQTERDTFDLPLLCVVYAGNEKKRFCMFGPNAGNRNSNRCDKFVQVQKAALNFYSPKMKFTREGDTRPT